MGIGGVGVWQLLIILAIVLMLFGGKRLGGLGADLGNAIKGFRRSMADGDSETTRQRRTGSDTAGPIGHD